jgi:hypothetical protein
MRDDKLQGADLVFLAFHIVLQLSIPDFAATREGDALEDCSKPG